MTVLNGPAGSNSSNGPGEAELYKELGKLTKDRDRWKESIPYLSSLLAHDSVKIQAKALWLLGEAGLAYPGSVRDAVPAIASFCDSPVPLLRERAVNALGRIGRADHRAVGPYWEGLFRFAADAEAGVRLSFIWASENIAVNTPDIYEDHMPVFAGLLRDADGRVRMEAPEIFRVLGKRRPDLVMPYAELLREIAETDDDRVVRIHCLGALRAAGVPGPKCRQSCGGAGYGTPGQALSGKEPDPLAEQAIAYMTELFRDNAGGHDTAHTLRVYRNAMLIADAEPGCDRRIVSLAALLHDVDDHKLFRTENDRNARSFLEGRVPADEIGLICECIDSVSFSRNRGRVPGTLEGKIVQDADRLDAMGAIGIARTFAYGGEHGRTLEDSVQHFRDKLLLLRDMMNTETAKRIAEKRHAFLEAFLRELGEETDTGDME